MVFATPAMTTSQLLFAVISTAYLVVAIPFEERSLVANHREAFTARIRDRCGGGSFRSFGERSNGCSDGRSYVVPTIVPAIVPAIVQTGALFLLQRHR